MKSLYATLLAVFFFSTSFAQTLICPQVLTTKGLAVTNVEYTIETIEPGQTSGPITDAPMNNDCIDFDALPPVGAGGFYRVFPEKEDNYTNGISTLDMVLIMFHLLGIQHLDRYQQIVADVNGTHSISTFDLLDIKKLILQITTTFHIPAWIFVDASIDPNIPNTPLYTFVEIDPLNPPTSIAFFGLKAGDVNGSSIPFAGEAADRGTEELIFKVEDRQVSAGETVTVDFLAKDFQNLLAYQFTLTYDHTVLEFVNQEYHDLPETLISGWNTDNNPAGQLPNIWAEFDTEVNIDDNAVLFSLTFNALKAGLLSDLLNAGSEITENLAFKDGSDNALNVVFDFGLTTNTTEALAPGTVLFQNQPNPVDQVTQIPFELDKAEQVQILLSDASGKTIKAIQIEGVAGKQLLSLHRSDFGAAGVYFYTLQSSTSVASKRLIIK